jgi:DNA polymerase-3 subunit gamma/tau
VRESSPLSLTVSESARQASPSYPGSAVGDGSGLIDIRQLANLSRGALSKAPANARPTRTEPDHDPLAGFGSFGNANGLSFATLDSLAPVARKPEPSGVALPLAILSGSAMIAVAALAAAYITGGSSPSVQSVALEPAAPVVAPAAQPVATPAPSALPAVDEPESLAVAQPKSTQEDMATGLVAERERSTVAARASAEPNQERAARETPHAVREREAPEPSRPAKRAPADKPSAVAEQPAVPAPAVIDAKTAAPKREPVSLDDVLADGPSTPAPTEVPAQPAAVATVPASAAAPASKEPPSIDSLLDQAVDAKPVAPAAAAPPLLETPSRDQVSTALKSVEAQVMQCAAQAGEPVQGTADVELTIAGATGRVMSVRVTGIQGPVGSCVARAARAARFPQFTRDRLTVNYPYRLSK